MARPPALTLTGGTARGTKLHSVPGRDVRPALARMRISLFEILRSRVESAHVADLFAGTGSLGLEALSRGAADAVFLDVDARCIEVLRKNLEKLRFTDRGEAVRGSAFEAPRLLARFGRTFDLVFLDPPYALYDEKGRELEALAAGLRPLMSEGGLVLAEHRTGQALAEGWAGGELADRRTYGGTTVSFYAAVGGRDGR